MGMPNPLPIERRERAVRAYDTSGETQAVVAARFGLNPWTLMRWVARQRTTGSVAPEPKRGGRVSPVDRALLVAVVRETPDATTAALACAYNARVPRAGHVHRSSILRALHRLQFVFKKNGRGPRNWIGPTSSPSARSSAPGRKP